MRDIDGLDDIKFVVDTFYNKVRKDELLSPIFASRITDWQPHLDIMYRFWNAALFGVREYAGNPFMKHAELPIDGPHFEQWIKLFYETLEEHFEGPATDEAKRKAMIMAHTFYSRIQERREAQRDQITVYVTIEGREHTFKTYPGEYRNLMMLIYDKIYIEDFGECKGIGRCGTCHVHVMNRPDLYKRVGNESTTLGKMPTIAENSRLACHIFLDTHLDGLKVEVVHDEDPGLY